MHTTYFELYRMRTHRHWLRQKLVAFAKTHGIKAAVREFGCSRNTVRKWLRRHVPGKPSSLQEHSRRPRRSPRRIPSGLEGQIVKLRHQTGFGAERLQREFALPCSHNAIARVLRQHHLLRPRKKKPATKKLLRALKRNWPLFSQLSADTKYLQDIPHYWPQMNRLHLPRFQYTVREPVSGACFTGYADELSKSYATLLATQLSAHLAAHGVNLTTLVWQTDNGSEFQVNQHHQGLPATVRALGSDHRFIPPKRYTWQSDVETVHRLVEDEFFDRETFSSPQDFWAKITTYWLYFNLVRPNRGKEWQSPLQILNAKAPALAGALIHWLPLNLSQPHHPDLPPPLHRGHDLPSFP
ncbi:helix-turn-helix domain-containing protein [Fontisphaera persica]|uniref:helix-turn-helix domain-containing protein n=1 Tax=Fontisphaera persica TaxID=2974023 RepID=UPI0024C034A1|nr:helix-turn-helix domain-containing protein [Fontisphaera persica]WCJ58044.1 helix-turn-helix domain-containing protein [Fontisphaera persica]